MRLSLELDRAEVAPGEAVAGTVVVDEGGRSRRLTVSLLYRERTRDYGEVARTVSGPELHAGALETGARLRFSLRLPDDALPALATPHGRLWWEVDAKSDELGRDTHATRELTVVPRG